MSRRDRTREFQLTVGSLQSRLAPRHNFAATDNHQQLHARHAQFNQRASAIARDIQVTAERLEKLGALAKRKTLFDDRSVEINELTHMIKRDIAGLNGQIAGLQQLRAGADGAGSKQAVEHSSNIVVMLQSRLANTSMAFKDVLEVRTENMRTSRDRRQQLLGADSNDASAFSASPLYSVDRPSERQSETSDTVAIEMPMQSQQLEMVARQDEYIEGRATAIESIESTIAELGGIFQQLAHMVAEQRDTVQRIEANVDDMSANISGAQRELLKLYANVTSNRWLMIRIFIVLMVFFFLFVTVM
ncbi:syntaxin-5-like protein [Thamnocephalis sphaerospora]|uniref:Syntaxin-5-like protein n=1 Tax=Thamnocephalis sphaerospora TaxID=78915 RepID=A0A4P9XM74_9FUNG|nr:syntaxin-5-like protein [Thamnocephalis sphaerospora]|eukprot:RKP07003.1 syntaxin-5-like protein [Thamnocephalis sphaerospora]